MIWKVYQCREGYQEFPTLHNIRQIWGDENREIPASGRKVDDSRNGHLEYWRQLDRTITKKRLNVMTLTSAPKIKFSEECAFDENDSFLLQTTDMGIMLENMCSTGWQ